MLYQVGSPHAEAFINHDHIIETLALAKKQAKDISYLEKVLDKASHFHGINHLEAASILYSEDPVITAKLYDLAKQAKRKIYGDRIVMFAPLYLSNYCVNGCTYCPYHSSNRQISRRKLSQDEIRKEVIALQDMGHKRLALELGEDPVHNTMDYILESMDTIYSIHHKNGAIRRVNINIAATSVENYQALKEAEIGTYILFQETYHKPTYERVHPSGPKHDYAYHTEAMDRAMQGGIDDVGIGVLFGLYDPYYDIVGMLMHAEHLEAAYGVGPHTMSVPRIRAASEVKPEAFPHAITDAFFAKIVALLRITAPYTGLIVSTRESKTIREKVLSLGVSQLSAASSTEVGGYDPMNDIVGDSSQFETEDKRSLDEVVHWLLETGYIPSFCTACYREGRTGDRFMQLAKSGTIHYVCLPNALLTLEEYLLDYASPSTRALGQQVIRDRIPSIDHPKVLEKTKHFLEKIEHNQRDFRF